MPSFFKTRSAQLAVMGVIVVMFVFSNIAILFHFHRELQANLKDDLKYRSRITSETVSHFFAGKIHTILLLDRYQPIRDLLIEVEDSKKLTENPNYTNVINMFKTVDEVYLEIDSELYDGKGETSSGAAAWMASIDGDYLLTPREILDPTTEDVWVTRERPWFKSVEHSNGVAFTNIYMDIEFNAACLSIVKMITEGDPEHPEKQPRAIGVVGLDVFMPTVNAIMDRAQQDDHSESILIDGNGIVVYCPGRPFEDGLRLDSLGKGYGEIYTLLKDRTEGTALIRLDGRNTYVGFSRVPTAGTDWYVITVAEKELAEATMSSYLNSLLLVLGIDFVMFSLPFVFLITTERRRSAELHKAKEIAENASRAKSEFLANMSHEIRTPMNGVVGLAEILRNTPPLSSTQIQYLDTIQQSADALLTVINDILDFSKIEAGRLSIEKIEFELRNVLEEAAEAISLRIHARGVRFALEIDPAISGTYLGDSIRIRQVLLNLLGNASKFTEEGEITLKVFPLRTDQEGKTWIRFNIEDTGIGISVEKQKTIFQPFSQAESSTARRFGGTGLGLSISQWLIEMMDGSIGLRSIPGKGSLFQFELPLEHHNPGTKSGSRSIGENLKVVLFDIHQANLRAISGMLMHWEIEPQIAMNPEELRKEIENGPVELVLLGGDFPGCPPEKAAGLLQEYSGGKTVRFIIMQPLGIPVTPGIERLPGFIGVVSKPIRMAVLEDKIREAAGTLIAPRTPQTPEEKALAAKPQETTRALNILLVEDVRINVLVATTILEQLGHKVESALNGILALEKLRENEYDLVFMDCQMPEMDGYQCTEQLRKTDSGVKNPNVTVIAMTAHAMAGDREKCLEAGMDDYITKPISSERVAEIILHWTKKHTE